VPLDAVIDTGSFDFARAAAAPGWLAELRGSHTPETEEYGITSFVYEARRPFHPARFHAAMQQDWPGNVLRSKGYFWLASRHDLAGHWSQAGGLVRHGPAGWWWSAVPESKWPEDPDRRAAIRADFDGRYGDRRQQIVFIGQHLEADAMRARLDACLLDDAELAAGPDAWRGLPDPFPAWSDDDDD
jgi:G3E family GTPase